MHNILNVNAFTGNCFQDRMQAAMAFALRHNGTTLRIPEGVYTLTSALARQTQADVMAGIYGENPEEAMFSPSFSYFQGISFQGQRGTTLLAEGVTLLADGFMESLALTDCKDIRIVGLTIDCLRKPFSMGIIEHCNLEQGFMDVRFLEDFPINAATPMPRYCAYIKEERRFNLSMKVKSRSLCKRQVMRFTFSRSPDCDLCGQEFYVWHTFHFRPAILLENAQRVKLEHVTIHSQPGMGIVGHRSEDISLERLRVVPSAGLHMSTNTDATHFTSCKGYLRFEGCEFEGHGDDATNVHTFYHDIERLSETVYRGRVSVKTHSLTLDYPDVGDTIELVDKSSLSLRKTYRVLSCIPDQETLTYNAELDASLPEDCENCYLADVTHLPKLVFRECIARNHWARSVLIKTRGALIEDNLFFASALFAIHVAAESWWHEGVACSDIVIRGNTFIRCGEATGTTVGGICVEMAVDVPRGFAQKHLRIEDNIFDLPCALHALSIRNASDIHIHGNSFYCAGAPVLIENCADIESDV